MPLVRLRSICHQLLLLALLILMNVSSKGYLGFCKWTTEAFLYILVAGVPLVICRYISSIINDLIGLGLSIQTTISGRPSII